MSSEFMSSEESDTEDSENLLERSIPWRSNKVNNFFSELDKLQEKHRTGQGKRQRKTRVLIGESSSRPVPISVGGKMLGSILLVTARTRITRGQKVRIT